MNTSSSLESFTGKIKWYDPKKGFGIIIEQESKQEVFIHHSCIQENNVTKHVVLMENEIVRFQIVQKDNKISAKNVQPFGTLFMNEKSYHSESKSSKITNFNHQERCRPHRVKNTTDFEPNHQPVDLRLMFHYFGKYLPGKRRLRPL